MKLNIRSLFLLFVPTLFLPCCSSDSVKYLKIGETQKSGKFSETLIRLDYTPSSYGIDQNECLIELDYILHSYYNSTVSIASYYSYEVVFDNNSNNGGIYMFGVDGPSSIAPNSDEMISMTLVCFKDWKTATISYKDYDNKSYSFSIKSSDFPDFANNCYPTLKPGDSFVNDSEAMRITFSSIETTTVGSAYAGADSDNVEFILILENLTSNNISLTEFPSRYYLKCDSGFTQSSISITTPNLPTSLPANGTTSLRFILILNKQWQKMVFGYTNSGSKSNEFLLTVIHSEIRY